MVACYLLPITEIAVLFPPSIIFSAAVMAALLELSRIEGERDDFADITPIDT